MAENLQWSIVDRILRRQSFPFRRTRQYAIDP